MFAGNLLQETRLAESQLDRIRIRLHQGLHRSIEILNALQEAALIKKPVIYSHIKAAAGFRVEQTVQSICLHGNAPFIRAREGHC